MGDQNGQPPMSQKNEGANKRIKLLNQDPAGEEFCEEEGSSDVEILDLAVGVRARQKRMTAFGMMNANATSRSAALHRRMRFPYACSYTHAAKKGGTPLLAVATEQGSVQILDTSKRNDWDCEPQRTTMEIHQNGIFDVQWSTCDSFLATVSGDQSTRITNIGTSRTLQILRGHTSTVKSVAWDPSNPDMLSTGGRDGAICLWDLRVQEMRQGAEDGIDVLAPVLRIAGAGGGEAHKSRRGKATMACSAARSVPSLVYPEGEFFGLISSSSFDGILRHWDLRLPTAARKNKSAKQVQPTQISSYDPTMIHGSRRPHGIASVLAGYGPSAGLLFGLGTDSRIYTYMASSLQPLAENDAYTFSHPNMQTNSFYVRLSLSPNGQWLASGSAGSGGSAFLYDVSRAGRANPILSGPYSNSSSDTAGVELKGQTGEVGSVDWAEEILTTCADDGTVRIWRNDVEVKRLCEEDATHAKWDWAWAEDEAREKL
ncbi:hypothetical protein EW146_g3230 [Bondarzewia mesenterica]|uniref:Anaphase-promoting complex subunit 4 WD40 domain-containing protein n=1 Tax=Bondarzewia mesenterica TaxID=1095465 RepID=A0A4S4LYB5_9AGAM|nr:hypothetical protein EW146_g3230 [Bondarzewia mesenterica]